MVDAATEHASLLQRRDRDRWRVSLVSFDAGFAAVPLANALATRCDVLLQTPATQLESQRGRVSAGVTVHELEHPRLRQPLRQAMMLRSLQDRSSRFGADVVHLQQGQFWFNLMLLAPTRTPLVVTVHDPRPHVGDAPSRKTPPAVSSLAFRRADHLIAHSETVRDRLMEEFGFGSDRISVVPLLPPAADPPTTSARSRVGRRPTILFFGRIWPYKGLDQLLQAEDAVAAAVPDVRIVVAGDGEDWSRYESLVSEPDRYDLRLRYVSDQERHALFDEADVVVLPYIDATQSGVVTLAHRYGRAVVASDVGGLAEQVDDGRTGLLVPPGDPEALAAALVRVLTDDGFRDRLGSAGREDQAATTNAGAVAERTLDAYASAVARSAS